MLDTLHRSTSLQRVLFVSQRQAEVMRPPRRSALISITDPRKPEAALLEGWSEVLRLKFDDVDPVTFPGQDTHLSVITSSQVAAIAAFVATHSKVSIRLVVHCRHGVSRSAAVAKAAAESLGVPFPPDYDEYNQFVYLSLRKVIRHAVTEA